MQLDINGTLIDKPTRADVERGIPSGPAPADWSIELVRDDGFSIEADAAGPGRFNLAYYQGRECHETTREVSAKELREIFALLVEGNEAWRSRITWRKYEPPKASLAASKSAANWYWLVPIVGSAAVYLLFELPSILRLFGVRLPSFSIETFPLPKAFDSIAARMLLVFAGLILLVFVVALVAKLYEVRRAARWQETMARIVSSGIGPHYAHAHGEPTEVQNVARVSYEFTVDGKRYTGTRIDLAEKPTEGENEDILQRYPAGKIVPVYYDPANPMQCVLERKLPKLIGLGCLVMLIVSLALVAGLMWIVTGGPAWIKTALPNSQPYVLTGALAIGALLLLFFLADRRTRSAAARWPTATGTVAVSDIEAVTKREVRDNRTTVRTFHYPLVEYKFPANGREYHSRQIRLGAKSGGSEGYARKIAARYPLGSTVTVHYNPSNPSECALDLTGWISWVLLAFAAAACAVAVFASGLVGS